MNTKKRQRKISSAAKKLFLHYSFRKSISYLACKEVSIVIVVFTKHTAFRFFDRGFEIAGIIEHLLHVSSVFLHGIFYSKRIRNSIVDDGILC